MADDSPQQETPEAREQRYCKVLDGQPLETLECGLIVIRRKKHECISLQGLSREQLVRRTGKVQGSKFSAAWSRLASQVEWMENVVTRLHWTKETGPTTHSEVFDTPVGVSKGLAVHTIPIRSDGRYVHAYPVEDSDE